MTGTALVTGGAGHIGSHLVRQLGEAGRPVVVLDNLSEAFREAVLGGELVVGDESNIELVSRLLAERNVEAVYSPYQFQIPSLEEFSAALVY